MKKQIVVIGLGRFGSRLASTLTDFGHEVLAIDKREDRVNRLPTRVTKPVLADATNENVLKELGVGNFDVGIVAIGYDPMSSILATTLLKKLGVRYIVARAQDELHGEILSRVGADMVVNPEIDMGARIAHSTTFEEILDHIVLTETYGVSKLAVPTYLIGLSLSEIGFGRTGKTDHMVLILQRQKEIILIPDRAEVLRAGDILIIAGPDNTLDQLLDAVKKNGSRDRQKSN
jgi:trk system potassium uptake protein